MVSTFHSILHPRDGVRPKGEGVPACLIDLNLDQVIDAIVAPFAEAHLRPYFLAPLDDVETIRYRQDVVRDLEAPDLLASVRAFTQRMDTVQRYLRLAQKTDTPYYRQGWMLEAALIYTDGVLTLDHDLSRARPQSLGFRGLRDYVRRYVQSDAFRDLHDQARQVKAALAEVRYCVILDGGKFKVKRYEGETDYSVEVEAVFAKFHQGEVEDYLVQYPERTGMSHIEAKILEFVAKLYPEPFAALEHFCAAHADFVDPTLQAFARDVQFYIAYLDFISDLRRQGLPFCYPQVSETSKEVDIRDSFDLALAHRLRHSQARVVRNDASLHGAERILVVTGPNQGGKTTFARMFGQVHYLARLGLPVPGRAARVFLFDHLFTHFEREEDIRNLRGKLEDDLVRIRAMLDQATSRTIFILNEIFASTTLQDAIFLSEEIMARLIEKDVIGVWVTFLDELASWGEQTVSMVALVSPEDPTVRTFKIVRKPADGLAYALSLAHKHGLTYEQLQERLR